MTSEQRLEIAKAYYPDGMFIHSLSVSGYGNACNESIKGNHTFRLYSSYSGSISNGELSGFIYDGMQNRWAKEVLGNGETRLPPGLADALLKYHEPIVELERAEWKVGDTIPHKILDAWCDESPSSTNTRIYNRGLWGQRTSNPHIKWESDREITAIKTIQGKLAGELGHLWIELDGLRKFMDSGRPPSSSSTSIFSSSNINQNGKISRVQEGHTVKVQRFVSSVTRGQRPRGTEVQGRRRKVAIAVGHLSNCKVSV